MKLYCMWQVREKSLQIYGSIEALTAEIDRREKRRKERAYMKKTGMNNTKKKKKKKMSSRALDLTVARIDAGTCGEGDELASVDFFAAQLPASERAAFKKGKKRRRTRASLQEVQHEHTFGEERSIRR